MILGSNERMKQSIRNVFTIFQFQIQKTGETDENVKWSHGLSKGGETKISPSWSQVTWGGELIGLVQYVALNLHLAGLVELA